MTTQPGIAEAAANLSHSLARLADSSAAYVRAQVDQAGRGLLAERRRRVWMLAGAAAAVLWLGVASLFAGLAIVAAFRDTHPALAAAWVAGGFLALAAIAVWILWLTACRRPSSQDWISRLVFLFAEYRRWTR